MCQLFTICLFCLWGFTAKPHECANSAWTEDVQVRARALAQHVQSPRLHTKHCKTYNMGCPKVEIGILVQGLAGSRHMRSSLSTTKSTESGPGTQLRDSFLLPKQNTQTRHTHSQQRDREGLMTGAHCSPLWGYEASLVYRASPRPVRATEGDYLKKRIGKMAEHSPCRAAD